MPATTRPMLFDHLLALVLLCAAMPTIAAERHALIIGNAAYQGEAALKNTLNDARDMARLLAGLGFEIAGDGPLENADRNTMARAINRFVSRVQGRDGIALIYYSGHGMRDRHDANLTSYPNGRFRPLAEAMLGSDARPPTVTVRAVITDVDKVYPAINAGDCLRWPDSRLKEKAGVYNWDDFYPSEAVGRVSAA